MAPSTRRTYKHCKKCGTRARKTGQTFVWRGFGGTPKGEVTVYGCPRCLHRMTSRKRAA